MPAAEARLDRMDAWRESPAAPFHARKRDVSLAVAPPPLLDGCLAACSDRESTTSPTCQRLPWKDSEGATALDSRAFAIAPATSSTGRASETSASKMSETSSRASETSSQQGRSSQTSSQGQSPEFIATAGTCSRSETFVRQSMAELSESNATYAKNTSESNDVAFRIRNAPSPSRRRFSSPPIQPEVCASPTGPAAEASFHRRQESSLRYAAETRTVMSDSATIKYAAVPEAKGRVAEDVMDQFLQGLSFCGSDPESPA